MTTKKMSRSILVALALIFSIAMTSVNCQDHHSEIQQAFLKLQQFIQSDGQPKGTPFTRLKGKPLKNDRIAIVGAGLAGLHMAYLLQKKGFKYVTVLEKESRVGGKVYSVQHNGVPHEMGACYTSPDYLTNVYELAEELGIKGFVSIPPSTVWLDGILNESYGTFVIKEIMKLTGAKNLQEALRNLFSEALRYAILHRELFGKYEHDLMPKPSEEVLHKLNHTILSFLKKNNLLALVPLLKAAHTMQGYGQIDETSILYGMMWDTPKFIVGMLARALGTSDGGTELFRKGFMQITDKLAAKAKVRLNVNIKKIHRYQCFGRNHVKILYDCTSGKDVEEKFDFLIWAADAREALKVLDRQTSMEKLFSRQTNKWFTTTLLDSLERCRSPTAVEYWLDNLEKKREHAVWARRHSGFALKGTMCNSTLQKNTRLSGVVYQMGSNPPCKEFVGAMFDQQIENSFGAKDVKIVERKTWNYFPRFSVRDIADGILWKVAEDQGKRGTWFIGGSVCFESTKSIIEYNKLMIKRMDL